MGLIAIYSGKACEPAEQPNEAVSEVVALATGTYPAGQVIGELTATPGTFAAYAAANSDGSQVAKMILRYAYIANADGTVNPGNAAAGELGQTERGAIAWRAGAFKTVDVVGLDANAVGQLGKLARGTVADGLLIVTGE
jgi:hypothetical protein